MEFLIFPKSLEKYKTIIEQTAKPVILISKTNTLCVKKTQSKFGGIPYFPYDYPIFVETSRNCKNWTPWPKQLKTGKELSLLIQINFEEIPHIEPFPKKGILQLFVDDNYWHDLGDNYYCIYHETIIEDSDFHFNDFGDIESTMSNFRIKENAIKFFLDKEFITVSDFRFESIYSNSKINGISLYKKLQEHSSFVDYLKITDHKYSNHNEIGYGRNKIGGYHYSQNAIDPRSCRCFLDSDWEDSLLLFQFQDYDKLSWGDCGSAQFFIKRCDLENLDFSNLLFHWDST